MNDIKVVPSRLREGAWAAGFLALLAALLAPLLVWSEANGHEVSVAEQAVLILAVTWLCQRLRKQPLSEAVGKLGPASMRQFLLGIVLGAILMLAPAALLALSGATRWTVHPSSSELVVSAIIAMLAVAFAEELLFRGFLFQRLLGAIGLWPAQLVVAGLFLLTHMSNPGMDGAARMIAGANIFAASLLFGFAYVRTRSLAMPIGIHWAANLVQGPVLGLGVSGTATASLLAPEQVLTQSWLTGGAFGLEASVPGLIIIMAALLVLRRRAAIDWRRR
jgi:membrane protease YdiL (CAAX protease family)